jgi:CrcB protein
MKWVLLFAAGGAGTLLRYALSGAVQARAGAELPWGTLAVNFAGCFAAGFLATTLEERSVVSAEVRIVILIGLLGGFTTFSSFGLETWRLLETGQTPAALANAAGSVVSCLAAVAVGAAVARGLP